MALLFAEHCAFMTNVLVYVVGFRSGIARDQLTYGVRRPSSAARAWEGGPLALYVLGHSAEDAS